MVKAGSDSCCLCAVILMLVLLNWRRLIVCSSHTSPNRLVPPPHPSYTSSPHSLLQDHEAYLSSLPRVVLKEEYSKDTQLCANLRMVLEESSFYAHCPHPAEHNLLRREAKVCSLVWSPWVHVECVLFPRHRVRPGRNVRTQWNHWEQVTM